MASTFYRCRTNFFDLLQAIRILVRDLSVELDDVPGFYDLDFKVVDDVFGHYDSFEDVFGHVDVSPAVLGGGGLDTVEEIMGAGLTLMLTTEIEAC